MVNKKNTRISSILDILKNTEEPVSGEYIAEILGVSRVAVWKIISGLRASGYKIESTHSGYRLLTSSDKPLPWELEQQSGNIAFGRIEYFDEIDSTMTKADLLINSGCTDGTTVIAGTQTAGLSSDGRRWQSPEGGLYFTRIRRVPFPAAQAGLYTIALCRAVTGTLQTFCKIDAEYEWPNAVTSGGRKIGGILTEFRGKLDLINSAAAGIGLNINTPAENLPDGALSIFGITGKKASVKNLTALLLEAVETADGLFPLTQSRVDELIDFCRDMPFIRRSIELCNSEPPLQGRIIDLTSYGALEIETLDGHKKIIYSGENIEYGQ